MRFKPTQILGTLALTWSVLSPITATAQTPPAWGQPQPGFGQPMAQGIVVNGAAVSPQDLAQMGVQPGTLPAGRYWYDAQTGAWGQEGAGYQGFIQPGLRVGGPLQPNASNGRTGVFINGRQLPQGDLMSLQQAVGQQVPQGRYWCRANGDCGQEGNPQMLVNLHAKPSNSQGGASEKGGSYEPYHSRSSDGSSISQHEDGCIYIHGSSGGSFQHCPE